MEPMSIGEMLQRAPLTFVMAHIGAFTVGYYFPEAVGRMVARIFRRKN